jgi:hypothetical protein
MTLAAPAISFSGALTTGLNGTSPAVRFPLGYGVTLAATVAATTLAAALAIGAAAGMLLAAHRGPVRRQPRQPSRAAQPARPSERAGAHARKEKEVMPMT